MKNSHTQFTIT